MPALPSVYTPSGAPSSVHAPPAVPPVPVPTQPLRSEYQTSNDACIKRLEELNIAPAAKLYPAPTEPGKCGVEAEIQTNVFGIEMHQDSLFYQYSVHITTELKNGNEVTFTKKGKDETSDSCLIYDGQSILFSNVDLFQGFREGAVKTKYMQLDGGEIDHKDLKSLPCIKLEVFPTKNPAVKFTREDVARRASDSNLDSVSLAYQQILELALTQPCIRNTARYVVFDHGKMFFIDPLGEGFEKSDVVDVGDGKQVVPGLKKTINFIEGPYGRGRSNPSVVIDGMKVAFHKNQPILDKLKEITTQPVEHGLKGPEKDRCAAVIKGLDCYSTYGGRERHHKIEGIHHEGAGNARFQLNDGGSCTVAQYFEDVYNITLRYPGANLIVSKERGNINFYPMELLKISSHQRVQIPQQTSAQSQKTTKESAVMPDVRQRLIMTGKNAAQISSDNEALGKMGVSVCEEPLMVKGRSIPAVKLANAENGTNPINVKDNKWRPNRFTRPATAPNVWAIYVVGTTSTRITLDTLKKFADEFAAMCKSKGVNMPAPADMSLIHMDAIESRLYDAMKANCMFVFIITDDSITTLHQRYKVIEKDTKMIIQDMKLSKALSVINAGKRLTLENVINKTNVKLRGSNYVFVDVKKQLDSHLIIGVGISAPPAGTKYAMENKGVLNPNVIGYAYNAQHNQEFSGDFMLNSASQDTLAPIEDIVMHSLSEYQRFHNGGLPRRVIIYRTETSEGNHGSIMAYEIPLVRVAMRGFSPEIQLVYIVVSKDHSFRFFKPDVTSLAARPQATSSTASRHSAMPAAPKAWDLNIAPGIMVDSIVTNPACKQFFLNSHITLQGTAKTPLYTVLADDAKVSMTALEDITYKLCHLHQIVGLPTSLPTSLYVANEYAKRGRNLWNEAVTMDNIPSVSGPEADRLRELTSIICYKASGDLTERRVNA
nr:hypothetical protein C06A1.4 - Caenorhabditis elegans [Caenorhabditis elegans]